MKKILGIIVLSLLLRALVHLLNVIKSMEKLYVSPPGGTEVSAKWKSNYSITY